MSIEELFNNAVEHWRLAKGIGTAIVPPPVDDRFMLLSILQKFYARNPTLSVLIVTNDFNERTSIIEFLTHQDDEENNAEFKSLIDRKILKIYTNKFTEDKHINMLQSVLHIIYRPIEFTDNLKRLLESSMFKLVILNRLFVNKEDNLKLYNLCPLLDDFKYAELEQIRLSSPVEEMWIGVPVTTDEDKELYDYYTKAIEVTINIFGSLDIVKQARIGNSQLNISAMQICMQIAQENGWRENLDMSSPYNQQIDELYNPNALNSRAHAMYEHIRNRSNLVSDYKEKLPAILDIIKSNPNKKILIISKRGEFATEITNYINNLSETPICGNYHDKVENIPAVDINGNPIYVKSGEHKGERRIMGVQAQKTLNEQLFNLGKLNVLSTSNAPDKNLCINVDIVIITSPLCDNIKSYLYRLNNVTFNDGKIKLYSIFCENTIEQTKLQQKDISENHIIVNKDEFNHINENKYDFILSD